MSETTMTATHGSKPVLRGLMDTAYGTWSPTYESDGINQDPSGFIASAPLNQAEANLVDQGTDGIDNDSDNGPDDFNERETHPPYNNPISGLKVTIRMIEKQSGEMRQSSIVHSYGAQ